LKSWKRVNCNCWVFVSRRNRKTWRRWWRMAIQIRSII